MNGQTDRQTKSSWWSITAFNDEVDYLLEIQNGEKEMPSFWKELSGGEEACPTSGKRHYQGCLHTSHTRMSQIKKVLPTAHIERCKATPELLKKYALKSETAVGEKKTTKNDKYYTMEDVLLKCAEVFVEQFQEETDVICEDDCGYQRISSRVVRQNFFLINLCSQPQMARAWKMYYITIINVFKERREETNVVEQQV